MTVMDSMMDAVIKRLPEEKREEMMINMMPQMMEGVDINALMPRMMANMLKDLTADDIVDYLTETLKDREKLNDLGTKIQDANLMGQTMFRVDTSPLGFDETIVRLQEAAEENGWVIPDTRDLQEQYHEEGLTEMTRCTILYFCNPQGGFDILTSSDAQKVFSVVIPTGVSVYETTDGQVEIAAMNFGLMSNFFSGVVKETFKDAGVRYQKSIEGVVEAESGSRQLTRPNDRKDLVAKGDQS
jgi:uncharacterized protein (DUF302 family)